MERVSERDQGARRRDARSPTALGVEPDDLRAARPQRRAPPRARGERVLRLAVRRGGRAHARRLRRLRLDDVGARPRQPASRCSSASLFPHSLGIFYTAVTQWLGFPKYGDEGKVMGLAPYGDPERLPATRCASSSSSTATRFELELDYFVHHEEGVDMTWDERHADDRPPLLATGWSELVRARAREPTRRARRAPRRRRRLAPGDARGGVPPPRARPLQRAHRLDEPLPRRRRRAEHRRQRPHPARDAVRRASTSSRPPATPAPRSARRSTSGTSELGQPRGFVMEHAYTGPEYTRRRVAAALARARASTSERLDDDAALRARRASGSPTATSSAGSRAGWSSARARSATARSSPTRAGTT